MISAAAFSAALAIVAGAFGAHAASGPAVDLLKTGGAYQLVQAVAVLVVAPRHRPVAWMLLAGAALFSLSLYALALGAPRAFGAITPFGGLAMIAGWLWLAFSVRR